MGPIMKGTFASAEKQQWQRWKRPDDNRFGRWHLSDLSPEPAYLCQPTKKLPRADEQSSDPPDTERCIRCEYALAVVPAQPSGGIRGQAPTLHCAVHGWYTTSNRQCPVGGCETADTSHRVPCPRITIPADLLTAAATRAAKAGVPTRWLLSELLSSALRAVKPE